MKQFFESKLVWVGVLQTIIAILELVADFLQRGDISPVAIVLLMSGVTTIVLRIWFTDTPIASKGKKI